VNYYNEFDKDAAAQLRVLIAEGLISPGIVDERSIEDVRPDELAGYAQCHFFAGIGVWSFALRLAGWPDDKPVWTGSCPCQPFSAAGKGDGFADERHLWPHFYHLISQRRPAIILGEQVDAALKSGWWDLVANDLESLGYAAAAAVIPASAVGAPHMRHRLFFVAKCGAESYNRVNAPHSKERNGNKNLPQMPAGKAAGSIFLGEAISGREALLLQAVRQGSPDHVLDGLVHGSVGGKESTAQKPCAQGAGLLASAQDDLPGEGAGLSGQAAVREEGRPVRSGPARERLAGADQCRVLRTDGDSVPAGRAEELRQSFAGSDRAGTWVHVCQRESCLLCDELRAGNMGRSAASLDAGSLEKEKGILKNDAIDVVQAHGKNDNDTGWQEDSGNQGVGAPHIRDRAYWVADANSGAERHEHFCRDLDEVVGEKSSISGDAGACFIDRLGCPDNQGPQGHTRNDGATGRGGPAGSIAAAGVFGGVADHLMQQRPDGQPGVCDVNDAHGRLEGAATAAGLCGNSRPGPTNGLWADADWLLCRDGKWRPVEPGTFPLAPAGTFRNRVAALRGAGNAINLKAAQAFIESVM